MQAHSLDKSRASVAALSQSSLNASKEQVSVISLSSYTRQTPKFLLPVQPQTTTAAKVAM